MAKAVHFPEADAVQDYPEGHPSRPLPVKTFPTHTVSCWHLDADERKELAATGQIWLTTGTFGSLPEPPAGDRHQPPVSLTTNSAIALRGWTEEVVTAPAADRFVSYADNQQGFDEVRASLGALAEQLAIGNDRGNLSEVDVQEAQREILILSHAFACEAIRTDWLLAPALKCLKWIAEKAAGATVGNLALRALHSLIRWFGP